MRAVCEYVNSLKVLEVRIPSILAVTFRRSKHSRDGFKVASISFNFCLNDSLKITMHFVALGITLRFHFWTEG